jgi:hypothetical protein
MTYFQITEDEATDSAVMELATDVQVGNDLTVGNNAWVGTQLKVGSLTVLTEEKITVQNRLNLNAGADPMYEFSPHTFSLYGKKTDGSFAVVNWILVPDTGLLYISAPTFQLAGGLSLNNQRIAQWSDLSQYIPSGVTLDQVQADIMTRGIFSGGVTWDVPYSRIVFTSPVIFNGFPTIIDSATTTITGTSTLQGEVSCGANLLVAGHLEIAHGQDSWIIGTTASSHRFWLESPRGQTYFSIMESDNDSGMIELGNYVEVLESLQSPELTAVTGLSLAGQRITSWSQITEPMYTKTEVDQMMADLRAEMAATYALKT